MPQPTGVVGHGVDSARDEMVAGNITMGALMEGVEAQ
jgi:hypothetical protein